eukprot:1824163-Amphidinium_carterae.2
MQAASVEHMWHWSFQEDDYESNGDIHNAAIEGLHVVSHCILCAPQVISSNEDLVPLRSYLGDYDTPKRKDTVHAEGQKRRKTTPTENNPAMEALLAIGTGRATRSRGQPAAAHPSAHLVPHSTSSSTSASDDESDTEKHWQELEDARTSIVSVRELVDSCFRIDLEGGSWALARHGRVIAGVRCHVRTNTLLHRFCKQHALPVSGSFSNNLYGNEGCVAAATLWRHKLHSLLAAWETAGMPESLETIETSSFSIPEDLQPQLEVMTGTAKKRVAEIVALRPGALRAGRT